MLAHIVSRRRYLAVMSSLTGFLSKKLGAGRQMVERIILDVWLLVACSPKIAKHMLDFEHSGLRQSI